MRKELHIPNFGESGIFKEVFIKRTKEAYEQKSLIYTKLEGTERIFYSRIIEPFCLPTVVGHVNIGDGFACTYLEAWTKIVERGLPAIPDVWKIGPAKVATTYLTEFGGGVYDQKVDGIIERDTSETDKYFSKIDIGYISSIAQVIAQKANKNYIELATDGPFHIYLDEQGNPYLILLDIGKIRIHNSTKTFGSSEKQNNTYYVSHAVRKFSIIQNNIKSLREARGLL